MILEWIESYWDALVLMMAEMAPYLLLGFFIAGLLRVFVPRTLYSRHLAPRDMKSVVKAAAIGVPLPLCSCGVIPTTVGLRKEGASHGACTSFLIATPQTGVDSIAATYSLMGLPFAIVRPLAALFTAMFGGWLVNRYAREDEALSAAAAQTGEHGHCCCGEDDHGERHGHSEHEGHEHEGQDHCGCGCGCGEQGHEGCGEEGHEQDHCCCGEEEHEHEGHGHDHCGCGCGEQRYEGGFLGKVKAALDYAFVDMMQDVGKWLVIGLLIAALITVAVPNEWLAALHDYKLLNMVIVLAVAIPMYVCATGSIPIAVSLMAKGLTPGAALVLLMAGPAVNSASILVIGKVFGRRTLTLYLVAIVIGAVLFCLGLDYLLPQEWFAVQGGFAGAASHCTSCLTPMDWVWMALLVVLLLNAFWQQHRGHGHHHGHGHGHEDREDHGECHGHNGHEQEHHHGHEEQEHHGHEQREAHGERHGHRGHEHHHRHGHEEQERQEETAVYRIGGMNCNHCKANVERAIRSVEGVTDVDVDLAAGTATVLGKHNPATLIEQVQGYGYSVEQ